MTLATVVFNAPCSSKNCGSYFVRNLPGLVLLDFFVSHVLWFAIPLTASIFVVIPLALHRLSR
jgi:hypothetical protein